MGTNISTDLIKTLGVGFLILHLSMRISAQNLYTARGYWQESTKQSYLTVKEKKNNGQELSVDEETYAQDYEAYLLTYFNRLSEDEKQQYARMKDQWDRELSIPAQMPQQPQLTQEEFEWRNRDRAINVTYGVYYGTSISIIGELDGAAAVGIPLITGGLWLLGPALNAKKYEGITHTTLRAANTGKILGLAYGAALGLTLGGDNINTGKLALGLSSVGSIVLGEIAFQTQKKKNTTDGKIELMRHYGFLGPGVGVSLLAATNVDNANLIGAGLLAGGVGGLVIGSKVASKYDYSRGDVDAISSLGVISSGLGFSVIANVLENSADVSNAIFLVPASFAVAGTLIGQRQVKNIHLTKKQGSTINLSVTGAGLVGIGVMALTEVNSPTAWVAVPSVLALVSHQAIFNKYKKGNLLHDLKGLNSRKKKYEFSMRLMPENYFVNKQITAKFNADPRWPVANPLVNMSLKFK